MRIGLPHPRGLHRSLRLHRRGKTARGRGHSLWTDEHGRVRHGFLHREFRDPTDAKPVGHGPHSRRLQRRVRRRRGFRNSACDPWIGYRGIDPSARGPLRVRRPQAHLRPRFAIRPHRLRLIARSDRPPHLHGRGQRPPPQRHGREGFARLHFPGTSRRGFHR